MVAGELARRVGHEGGLLRAMRAHERHQVVERVALDVELGLRPARQQRSELDHVVAADVARIGARVHGDALRPGLQAQRGGAHDARDAEVARVAQQRDLVDVDRQRAARRGGRRRRGDSGFIGGLAQAVSRVAGHAPPRACAAGHRPDGTQGSAAVWRRSVGSTLGAGAGAALRGRRCPSAACSASQSPPASRLVDGGAAADAGFRPQRVARARVDAAAASRCCAPGRADGRSRQQASARRHAARRPRRRRRAAASVAP